MSMKGREFGYTAKHHGTLEERKRKRRILRAQTQGRARLSSRPDPHEELERLERLFTGPTDP